MKTRGVMPLVLAVLALAPCAQAQLVRPLADLQWVRIEGEFAAALAVQGSEDLGKVGYENCVSCHLPSGAGKPDGSYPQLAGQHATVLIKQMADIRKGVRDNPVMLPYARRLTDAQGLADVAAYIQSLCIPADHGRYQGPDADARIASGKSLYEGSCVRCHGPRGEGDGAKFFPVIAGQHYKYLLRQMTDMRNGKRPEVHPEMRAAIKPFTDEQLIAVSAYQASLVMPGTSCPSRKRAAAAK